MFKMSILYERWMALLIKLYLVDYESQTVITDQCFQFKLRIASCFVTR